MLDETALMAFSDRSALTWWVDLAPRFGDLDVNGHVNNVAILGYVEEARLDVRRRLQEEGVEGSWVIASSGIRYLSPIGYPAVLQVGVAATHVGSTSFGLGYGVFVCERCAAVAVSRSVFVDVAGRKIPLPAGLSAALRAAMRG